MKMIDNILQGYENTKLIHYSEIEKILPLVPYEHLNEHEIHGILKGNFYVNGKLKQLYSTGDTHVGVIAATRLGKTTSYVIPTILSFAKQKEKKSLVISDPKNEVYHLTAATLKREGYKIKLLNFRDYNHSECWNPLTPIFRKYRKAMEIENEVRIVQTENGPFLSFQNIIYDNQQELDETIEIARNMALDSIGNDIDILTSLFVTVDSQNDPYWENSARDYLRAFIWAMLEDSNNVLNPITEETFSFSTILKIQSTINSNNGERKDYDDHGYFTNRKPTSRAYQLMKDIIINNAPLTRSCIIASFNTKLSFIRESTIRIITSCNSFDFSELVDGPVAVFIQYHDEIPVHYQMISLFIQDFYRYLIQLAQSNDSGKLEKPFYFILDEFGNFPRISNFENTISACGGRNIFFILIIQSYAQLNKVYGNSTSDIIRDNLNLHVFLGSNNPNTLQEFSTECGKKTRISPLSALNGEKEDMDHYQLETIPILPISALSHFEEGECIITEANSGYVLYSKLERYFKIDEMKNLIFSSEKDYVCPINPYERKYQYTIL